LRKSPPTATPFSASQKASPKRPALAPPGSGVSATVHVRPRSVERKTRATDVRVEIDLDGSGDYEVSTGIAFFDHMLESFAKHGLFDLRLAAKGDLRVDAHHTVEDVGIALGEVLREALGPAEEIRRYGSQVVPMAEAKVEVSVDISNRPYLVYRVELANDRIG
jgi:imidazoleglycerol-phosphate dehydratase